MVSTMESQAGRHKIGLDKLASISFALSDLRRSIEHLKDYHVKMGRYMEKEDKVQLAEYSSKLEAYWSKEFKKFVEKAKHYNDWL